MRVVGHVLLCNYTVTKSRIFMHFPSSCRINVPVALGFVPALLFVLHNEEANLLPSDEQEMHKSVSPAGLCTI